MSMHACMYDANLTRERYEDLASRSMHLTETRDLGTYIPLVHALILERQHPVKVIRA